MRDFLDLVLMNIQPNDNPDYYAAMLSGDSPAFMIMDQSILLFDNTNGATPRPLENTVELAQRIQNTHKLKPRSKRRRKTSIDPHEPPTACACCMEVLGEGGGITLPCEHIFHAECTWKLLPNCPAKSFQIQCPVCRAPVHGEDLPGIFRTRGVTHPRELQRVHNVSVAMQELRGGGGGTSPDFFLHIANIAGTRKADAFVYNVCLFNIDRALHWKKMLSATIERKYNQNRNMAIDRIVHKAVQDQFSTIMNTTGVL
jgi:hypothetical protein